MQKLKNLMLVLLIGCFLLNSSAVLAGSSETPYSFSVKLAVSEKEQKIIQKFDNVKKWIQEQDDDFQKNLRKYLSEFKKSVNKVFQDLVTKFNELKEKTLNKHYTLVTTQAFPLTLCQTEGYFFAHSQSKRLIWVT